MLSGIITAGPLILFAYATQRASMATMGLVQYLNPTLQFLCAVLVFGEPFTIWHKAAFAPDLGWRVMLYSSARSGRKGRRAGASAKCRDIGDQRAVAAHRILGEALAR